MTKKALWILFALLAIIIGLYPSIYLFIDRRFGLLGSKTNYLLANLFWNIGFYTHISFGALALLTGWPQFSTTLRNNRLSLHKRLGKIYVAAVMLSALAGIGIGFTATGGLVPAAGFICLGITWFSTTLLAYLFIRNHQIEKHQQMMVYSYAACFAAVTLRIWLPLLSMALPNSLTAYKIVAWLCWIPNLGVAWLINKRKTESIAF